MSAKAANVMREKSDKPKLIGTDLDQTDQYQTAQDWQASALSRVPTQARSRAKVERALAAAQELVESEGVGTLTLPRVAKAADVSVGALYQYLPDREAILAALTVMYHECHEARMDELIESVQASNASDPVKDVVRGVAQVYRDNKHALLVRTELQAAVDPKLSRGHKLRMVKKIESLLLAYSLVDEARAELIARTLFFAADGVMHEAFAIDPAGDPEVLEQLELLLNSYLEAQPQNA